MSKKGGTRVVLIASINKVRGKAVEQRWKERQRRRARRESYSAFSQRAKRASGPLLGMKKNSENLFGALPFQFLFGCSRISQSLLVYLDLRAEPTFFSDLLGLFGV